MAYEMIASDFDKINTNKECQSVEHDIKGRGQPKDAYVLYLINKLIYSPHFRIFTQKIERKYSEDVLKRKNLIKIKK